MPKSHGKTYTNKYAHDYNTGNQHDKTEPHENANTVDNDTPYQPHHDTMQQSTAANNADTTPEWNNKPTTPGNTGINTPKNDTKP